MLPMSSASSSGGSRVFSGFTRLCKGLSVVLVGGYVLLQIFPSAASYLTLIPARTIPFGWNLITAGYIEQSLPRVIISIIGLLFLGKLLEPIWGPKEFMKFILIVNFLTSVCVFVSAISLYYLKREEGYLYVQISGFQGVVLGFLVGIKQIMPDQELSLFSLLKIKAKWLPSLIVLASIVSGIFLSEAFSYLPTLVFGVYTSWIYLRYLQKRPETNLRGDLSDDFGFASFFPEFFRPIVRPVAYIFHRFLCGRSKVVDQEKNIGEGGSPLPGSDPIEASRRRERGARALEQRLAAEKSSSKTPDGIGAEDTV